jgi:hypothetical protein
VNAVHSGGNAVHIRDEVLFQEEMKMSSGFMYVVFGCVLCFFLLAVPSVHAEWVDGGIAICTAPSAQTSPKMTSDGVGGAIITWTDGRAWYSDIYAQRVDVDGNVLWEMNGTAICTGTQAQGRPNIASDGAGGAIIVWEDYRSPSDDDIYAQRVDANGNVLWVADGVPICAAEGNQGLARMISDGSGGAIVTWEDSRGAWYDIYAQRLDANGNVLWTSNGVAICTAAYNQEEPQLVSDGAGGAIITWYDYRDELYMLRYYDIYAQRVDADGNILWTANGVAICTAIYSQFRPQLVSDGEGGAIITWDDYRAYDYEIYAQRVGAGGNVLWTANGVAICTRSGSQVYPHLVSDGAGGAIITWQDYRPAGYDIYAQRVDADGNALWAVNGIAICTAAQAQAYPRLASDGAGGAIITWQDYRSASNYDIYAQRVDGNGNAIWITDGVVVCAAAGSQQYPEIVSSGSGAIVTWGDGDVYAQHTGFVTTGVEAAGPANHMDLAQSYPNPFNPLCTIRYDISRAGNVSLRVFDVDGSLVCTLVDSWREPGVYSAVWDGKDASGAPLASGVYFYSIKADDFVATRKMVLLK